MINLLKVSVFAIALLFDRRYIKRLEVKNNRFIVKSEQVIKI